MAYAIEAQGLRKSFKTREAVRGVDLAIQQGELFALLGPNGAGKTTTIHMLTTLLHPDEGTASICGYDVVKDAAVVRRNISVTGQYAALDESLTGWQNLTLFAGLHGYSRKDARALAVELLESFNLAEAGDRTVGTYSGGMRRRLDLAAGILSEPKVMFLDEPTTGLDPQSRRELWDAVRHLVKNGTTVLLTTQYLEEADQLADRIGFIAQGRVIAVDTPEKLKASIGGKTLTIKLAEGTDPANVCRLLTSEFGMEAHSDEGGLIVKAAVREAALAHSVIGTLIDQTAAVDDFALSEPTLDDVYFALAINRGNEVAS
ncbi:ATP-binding cassette domain-containing protein [Paenibacillus arenilitoris]|uniref:ATP-binding cassette domain-containing protein n=1 Tax=Paenibacillus arenilitoris TaxID=2772299 RepID=A0A927H630_9BACL|nr:ATP-binding cassette domain-containing protein [Paenibacillus arenilitoris]MBD2869163.1 ATP-binding cassette domain-containing protein [Paenibacillus arenilitoris]